jgi:hypothetical protein
VDGGFVFYDSCAFIDQSEGGGENLREEHEKTYELGKRMQP